jgi:hypothetical protein
MKFLDWTLIRWVYGWVEATTSLTWPLILFPDALWTIWDVWSFRLMAAVWCLLPSWALEIVLVSSSIWAALDLSMSTFSEVWLCQVTASLLLIRCSFLLICKMGLFFFPQCFLHSRSTSLPTLCSWECQTFWWNWFLPTRVEQLCQVDCPDPLAKWL